MSTLNLGILAHVDAGKTSLTERLLYDAGVIAEVGSVDDGSTRTDSLALERRRGITIRAAVVSFPVAGVTVNLIDTPGHPDFIAEVERVLCVLDGAVLVVSAVEGVQPQTRVLMRTLQRLRIPTLLFVNKTDRAGADPARVLAAVASRLTPAVVAMGRVRDPGTRGSATVPFGPGDAAFTARLAELLADGDEGLLAAYVEGRPLPYRRLRAELAAQTARARVHPVYFGSAITGAGVAALAAGVAGLLPAAGGDPAGPLSGTVFKVERGPAGEKVAYVRVFDGTLRVRDRLRLPGAAAGVRQSGTAGTGDRVTAVSVFEQGEAVPRDGVAAGRIGKVWGLAGVRIGDPVGRPRAAAGVRQSGAAGAHHFAPPTLETVVEACRPADRGALHAALTQLAEQDPLIDLRLDGIRQEISVSLYGEVQKEVIQATLAEEYGVPVAFRETTTVCIERPTGTGAAAELIGQEPNPFLATVGLRVEPASAGSGVRFRLGVELGSMPPAFFKAVEETVHETLAQGLAGWQVTDCTVTMTHSGYWARQSHMHGTFDKSMSSTAGDFRNLTPLATTPSGASCLLEGEVPAARVHALQQRLPGLTAGEGVLDCAFERWRPVRGPAPSRPRTDHNPLDRKEYLLRVVRRTSAPR